MGAGLGGLANLGFVAVWIAIWTAGTLAFDVTLIGWMIWEVRALGFPTTEGVVVSSRVVVDSDGEGTSYQPAITYRYTVQRQERTSSGVGATWLSSGSQEARRVVARYPAGSRVTVYYNPRDPNHSVLRPGLNWGHAMAALFLTPFNIITLCSWLVVCQTIRGAARLPFGSKEMRTAEGFTLKLYGVPPIAAAAVAALAVSFAGVFVAAFGSLLLPGGWLVGLMWIAVIGSAGWVYLRQRKHARLLAIDEFRGTFTLTLPQDRRPPRSGKLSELKAIATRKTTKLDSDGDEQHSYYVELIQQDKSSRPRHLGLVSQYTEQQAQNLCVWLATRLNLPIDQDGTKKTARGVGP